MKEPQKITLAITFIFKIEHNPGNENHLTQLVRSLLRGKGIVLKEDMTVEV